MTLDLNKKDGSFYTWILPIQDPNQRIPGYFFSKTRIFLILEIFLKVHNKQLRKRCVSHSSMIIAVGTASGLNRVASPINKAASLIITLYIKLISEYAEISCSRITKYEYNTSAVNGISKG